MHRYVVALVLLGMVAVADAKPLGQQQRYMCSWGSEVAGQAQQSKLAGISRYAARKRIQVRHYQKSWMRQMAYGITEQTYDSRSRLKPAAVKQVYYEGCVRHAVVVGR